MLNVVYQSVCNPSKWNMAKTACLMHLCMCKQQEGVQGACFRLTGEKGYHSVESGARHHFIIGLVIDLDDKTVRMDITKGHYVQALAPLHQYVLIMVDHLDLRRAEVLSSAMKIQMQSFFTPSWQQL